MKPLLTTESAAALLNWSDRHFYRKMKEANIKPVRIGKRYFWPAVQVQALERRKLK